MVRTILSAKSGLSYESPLWSPGARILFGFDGRLFSASVQGGKPQRVVFSHCRAVDRCHESNFILSPNRRVAAVTACDCGDPHFSPGIELVKLNAARPAALSTPLSAEEQDKPIDDEILAFSPGGKQLVFSRATRGPSQGEVSSPVLMAFRIGDSQPVPLTQSGIPGASLVPSDVQQVQWSPDGRWVAFVESQKLEVAPTAGRSAPHVLATDFGPCAFRGDAFSWSPNSKLLAYDGCPNQANARLMTVRPDGTHMTNLLKDRRLTYVSDGRSEGGPQWSPDGSRLVFLAHAVGRRTVHVWTIRADGSALTRLG